MSTPRPYDFIGFGDEIPGIFALVAAAREYRRNIGTNPRGLLMFKGNSKEGVGGHLVRGMLAYLDRSNVPEDVRQRTGLGFFGDPCSLYKEFLQRAGVTLIALDPAKANLALRSMLSESGIDIISKIEIQSVLRDGLKLSAIKLTNGETYSAKQFIDATVNAELAQAADVPKLRGFGTFGLPDSEMPVTLVFETEGLSLGALRDVELAYLRRFSNLADKEAQRFLAIAAGNDPAYAEKLRKGLINENGYLRTLHAGSDYVDIGSHALSIAYQSFRGKKLSLTESGAVLDPGNVAMLPGNRLLWNALLFKADGKQAEALARGAALPTPEMMVEFSWIDRWFRSLGAKAVRPAGELYIRHAGNITAVMEPLRGHQMLSGGVPSGDAIATFAYHFDVRGGISGLGLRANSMGISSISFSTPPVFNIGIRHALVKSVPNLAVISPGSGFDGYACSAGRIVEFNAAVGQGIGIAAAIALLGNRNLNSISNLEVRNVLNKTGQLPRIYGRNNTLEAIRMQEFETVLAMGNGGVIASAGGVGGKV
jgi:FAD dependent oxidoreductase